MKKQKTQSKLIVALTAIVILLVALSATLTFAYFTATNQATSTSMTFGELNLGTSAGLTLTDADTNTHAETDQVTGAIDYVVPGCSFALAGNITVKGNIDALVRAQLKVQVLQTHDANGVAYTAANIQGTETTGVEGVAKYTVNANGALEADADNGTLIGILTEAYGTTQNGKAATVYGKIETVMNSLSGSTAWVKVGNYTYFPKVVTATTAGTQVLNFTGNTSKIVFEANTFGNDWQGAMVKVSFVTQAIQAEHLVDGSGNEIEIGKAEPVSNLAAINSAECDEEEASLPDDEIADIMGIIAGAAAWSVNMATGV